MKVIKAIFKFLFVLILILAILVGSVLGLLTIFQFNPDSKEVTPLEGTAEISPEQGKPISIMTWNVGYAALGNNADFFMDGGKSVYTADKPRVRQNMEGIKDAIIEENADIYFIQEIDKDSDRSRHMNEVEELKQTMLDKAEAQYQTMFANNFKALYVPYPIPPIGKVDSGIMTMTRFRCQRADRIQLPVPFKWPVSTVNLKRCLLVTRVRLSGSDKYLILINLHLEAYDDGEGKVEQTKALIKIMNEEREAGNYVIAGGDFNQTFSSVDMSEYPVYPGNWEAGFIDDEEFLPDFTPIMDASIPTCRSLDKAYSSGSGDHQFYMIDGFVVSDNIKVNSIETRNLDFECSDHNPVVMEFVLK